MELFNLKGSFSLIFQIISGLAGILSIWIKLTIESNVNKTLADYKKDLDARLDSKFVQSIQLKAELLTYVSANQHAIDINSIKTELTNNFTSSFNKIEESQLQVLKEIKELSKYVNELGSKFAIMETSFNYEREDLKKDIQLLKATSSKWAN